VTFDWIIFELQTNVCDGPVSNW